MTGRRVPSALSNFSAAKTDRVSASRKDGQTRRSWQDSRNSQAQLLIGRKHRVIITMESHGGGPAASLHGVWRTGASSKGGANAEWDGREHRDAF